jgi:hypothetical protein
MLTEMQNHVNSGSPSIGDNALVNGRQQQMPTNNADLMNAVQHHMQPTMSVPRPVPQEQFEALERMTAAQNARLESLMGRLSPLSPSGNLFDHNGNAQAPPSDFDLDKWTIDQDYFPPQQEYQTDEYNTDFRPDFTDGMDFGFEGANDLDVGTGGDIDGSGVDGSINGFLSENDAKSQAQHGQVESVSSRGTTPVDSAGADEEVSSAKRRRIASGNGI